MDPHIQRLTAAYMTLGTFGHRETMPYYLDEAFDVATVDPDNYELFGARYFDDRGDVDNDGVWNIEEWRNAVRANGDIADITALALFVEAAMDRRWTGIGANMVRQRGDTNDSVQREVLK